MRSRPGRAQQRLREVRRDRPARAAAPAGTRRRARRPARAEAGAGRPGGRSARAPRGSRPIATDARATQSIGHEVQRLVAAPRAAAARDPAARSTTSRIEQVRPVEPVDLAGPRIADERRRTDDGDGHTTPSPRARPSRRAPSSPRRRSGTPARVEVVLAGRRPCGRPRRAPSSGCTRHSRLSHDRANSSASWVPPMFTCSAVFAVDAEVRDLGAVVDVRHFPRERLELARPRARNRSPPRRPRRGSPARAATPGDPRATPRRPPRTRSAPARGLVSTGSSRRDPRRPPAPRATATP